MSVEEQLAEQAQRLMKLGGRFNVSAGETTQGIAQGAEVIEFRYQLVGAW